MADRTSAALFGRLFEYLASQDTITREQMVEWLWKRMDRYDFHPCQMGCDLDTLVKLDLVRVKVNSEYPSEYEYIYRGEVGFDSLPRYVEEGK